MSSESQLQLFRQERDLARAMAEEFAAKADNLSLMLVAALNKLQPHDPEFVKLCTTQPQASASSPPGLSLVPSPNPDPGAPPAAT